MADKDKKPGLGDILGSAYNPKNLGKGAVDVAKEIAGEPKEPKKPKSPVATGKPDDAYSKGGGVRGGGAAMKGVGAGKIC